MYVVYTTTMNHKDVAREIRQDCLAVRMRLLSRVVSGLFDEELRPAGIRVSQLNILAAVANLEPVAPGDVARRLELEKSTLSRNLEIMRKNGWLKIDRAGRSHALRLTPKGAALLVEIRPLWRKGQKKAEAMLGSAAETIQAAGWKVGFGA